MDIDLQKLVLNNLEKDCFAHNITIDSENWRCKGISFTTFSQIRREDFLKELKNIINKWDKRLRFDYIEVDNGVYECLIFQKKDATIKNNITPKRKRIYDLPKYICYDKAESRNRERNVFQTQLKINGKLIKNNLYTVKEAVIYVVSKMLEHTDIWSLEKIADYLKTYDPEMENGNFIPSNTPKSPSWRKREKKKNIQTIKDQIDSKLSEILKFAKDNDINIDVNVS